MEIQRAYKVRLYPNKAQEQQLLSILGACRFVYNHFLEARINHYKATGKTLSYMLMSRQLTVLRHETEWMKDIQLEPLSQALRHLDYAYRRFFKVKKGFPNFKSKKDTKQSFQKHCEWRLRGNRIQIQKDFLVKFRGKVDSEAKLGTLTVSRHGNKWYASMTAEVKVKLPSRYTKPIGIDMGITHLAITSTGQKYENVRSQKVLQRKLSKAQRILARRKLHSQRRQKAKVEVARIHEKIANIKANHLHQVSHAITSKNHAMIAVEDLNVKGMMQNRKLSRALGDASIRELLRQIEYKQKWTGGDFVKIGRFEPTSKKCSACGVVKETMPLSVRRWKCGCGKTHDRDVNAAKNILSAAYAVRGESMEVR
jgi:putative transposase